MKSHWRETFTLFSETSEYRERISVAQEELKSALAMHEKAYCSYSGGKDSSVLLHMCLQADPGMLVFHWDFGRWLVPRPIEEQIIKNAKAIGAKNLMVETSKRYEKYQRNAPGLFGKTLFGKIEPELIKKGYDLCVLGLRAEESSMRKARTKNGMDKKGKINSAHPIRGLLWQDVWAYLISHNLPYLGYYDQQEEIGIGYDRARLGTFFVRSEFGQQNVDAILIPEHMNQYL